MGGPAGVHQLTIDLAYSIQLTGGPACIIQLICGLPALSSSWVALPANSDALFLGGLKASLQPRDHLPSQHHSNPCRGTPAERSPGEDGSFHCTAAYEGFTPAHTSTTSVQGLAVLAEALQVPAGSVDLTSHAPPRPYELEATPRLHTSDIEGRIIEPNLKQLPEGIGGGWHLPVEFMGSQPEENASETDSENPSAAVVTRHVSWAPSHISTLSSHQLGSRPNPGSSVWILPLQV